MSKINSKNIDQLIKDYFYVNGKRCNPYSVKVGYKNLLIDLVSEKAVLQDKYGQPVLLYDEKVKKTAKYFTSVQEKIDRYIKDYVEHNPKDSLAQDIGKVIGGEMREFTPYELSLALPTSFNKADACRIDIKKCMSDWDTDLPKDQQAENIKDCAREVKALKPAFWKWIFKHAEYVEQMEVYHEVKKEFQCCVQGKFYPGFLAEHFGTPAKVSGIPVTNLSTTEVDGTKASLERRVMHLIYGSEELQEVPQKYLTSQDVVPTEVNVENEVKTEVVKERVPAIEEEVKNDLLEEDKEKVLDEVETKPKEPAPEK